MQAALEPDDLDISLGDLIHFPMSEEFVDMTDPGNLLNAEDSMDFEEESLERICLSTRLDNSPTVDAKVIDSAATVQMLTPKVVKTFQGSQNQAVSWSGRYHKDMASCVHNTGPRCKFLL